MAHPAGPPAGAATKELVTIALARLARSDVSVADSYLRREWAKSMAKSNLAWVRGQYALAAALNLDSRANDWYHEAGHIRMTEYNAGWKVRAALRQPKIDWKWVIESIDEMPPIQRADTSWVYWKARGLAATGRRTRPRPPTPASPTASTLRPAGRRGTGPPHHGAAASRADHRRRDRRGARQPWLAPCRAAVPAGLARRGRA